VANAYGDWEPVIGLEVHAQLFTRTKTFCGCLTSFGDPPNTHVCPVCLGLPGALPVLNAEALAMAITASLALGCTVHHTSVFARKNYFYPDLPKGYQTSQYDKPLATGGKLVVDVGEGARTIGITRVHMEEDAGKNLHGVGGWSLVDLNRAGTPLIEIVSEPDVRAPAEARAYLKQLHEILMFAGVNDGNLEQGSFRCDANVSVRKPGAPFGTRVEMKNINSFRFVEDAIDVEIRRQIRALERGEPVKRQTRGYNSEKRESYLLREKEGEEEYRYFPDPDLPPLVAERPVVDALAARVPELPADKRARFVGELGLSESAAEVLTGHPQIARFFEEAALLSARPIKVANFVQAEVLRDTTTRGLDATFPVSAKQVAEIVELVEKGAISGKQAKQLYADVRGKDTSPKSLVESLGLKVIADLGTLQKLAAEVVAANPKQRDQYRAGKTALLGFFVGQLMKATQGSADPKLASQLLKRELDQ
jgi:aspartyl-tRNA(Asn)/glutamyl-tRNA(Gln) amidotransferase subunit B